MIISKKHKFIYLKGRKVAGSSVEIALSQICGPDDIITQMTTMDERMRMSLGGRGAQNYGYDKEKENQWRESVKEGFVSPIGDCNRFYWNHMPLKKILRKVNFSLDGYRIYGNIRNPYEMVVSYANWIRTRNAYTSRGEDINFVPEVIYRLVNESLSKNIQRISNLKIYKNNEGVCVITPLRVESLDDDFGKMMRELGVENPPELPHAKDSGRRIPAIEILKPHQIQKINEAFREDFEAFGYQMIEV